MNTSSIWPSRTSTTAAPRREARKPTASASASTKPSCRSSIRWRSANASTPASSSCRLTSIPGSPGTTNSDHIRGAGATAKRQCKPSLTLSHSPGRNHWPHDVGQTQPFRHQTGQLSDQVSASTAEHREPCESRGSRTVLAGCGKSRILQRDLGYNPHCVTRCGGRPMRGGDLRSEALFSYLSCEARVPLDHPLRPIQKIVDEAWCTDS